MKKIRKLIKFENIVFLLYFILTLILVLNHEFARDEAQVWLIVKNLDVVGIIKQMQYEGHPCLWHLIVNIFAQLGFSYNIIGIISWGFALLSVWLLLYKSSFNKITKILLCFNISFVMYYSVVARSYSLVMFLIIWLATIYRKRREHPYLYGIIMALLVNTHVLTCGLVGSLLLIDFIDIVIKKNRDNVRKRLYGIGITLVGIVLLFLQLYKCFTVRNQSVSVNISIDLLFEVFNQIYRYFNFQCIYNFTTCIAIVVFIIFLVFYKKNKHNSFWILLLSLGFNILVHMFIYQLYPQHSGLLILISLFCIWILNEDKQVRFTNILFNIILLLMIPGSIYYTYTEITNRLSDAPIVVDYIHKEFDNDSKILCIDANYCTSIIAYLDNKDKYEFISYSTLKEFTYIEWNVEDIKYSFDINDISNVVNRKDIDYVIIERKKEYVFNEIGMYEKVYESDTKKVSGDEEFIIYKIVKKSYSEV